MEQAQVNYIFLDMNSYFASVAQQEEPRLRGRPVGIVTVEKPGACCIAASYEAKRFGIGVGTRMSEARELCPDIEFRPARHDLYVEYHHRIIAAMERVHPIQKAHSVDEFSIRLLGTARQLETAKGLAESMRRSILRHVGPAMRCSIGLGGSKLLAKLAGEMKKPDGLTWLLADEMPGKIAHLKLGDLPGVGKRMETRLINSGVTNVEALFTLQPKHARKLWGSVNGERFVMALQGHDVPDPDTKPHSLGHGQILSRNNRNGEGARLVARRLLIKAGTRLRRGDFFANQLYLSCKDEAGEKRAISIGIPATQDTFDLLHHFSAHWPKVSFDKPACVGIMLGGLTDTANHTADLFEDRPAPGLSTGREALCAAVDSLNQRFGQDTIIYGERPKEITPYSGAKIAFGRIPGREEFRD